MFVLMQLFEKLMEPTEEGEENTSKVQVTGEMTRDEVVQRVLEVVGGAKVNIKYSYSPPAFY